MEKQISEVKRKIRALNFRIKKIDDILQKHDRTVLERNRISLKRLLSKGRRDARGG